MILKHRHYMLKFRQTFHIAAGARDTTDAVFAALHHEGYTGYGEVALPPYLDVNAGQVIKFLSSVNVPDQYDPSQFDALLAEWTVAGQDCIPGLAALDIALHDLQGKLLGKPLCVLLGFPSQINAPVCFTIGMSAPDEMRSKLKEADAFHIYKLKMGGKDDRAIAALFRQLSGKPFCVDANRGWDDFIKAEELCKYLMGEGCVFAEQPFGKSDLEKTKQFHLKNILPIILDESVQRPGDVLNAARCSSGINIKLVKCGGLAQAAKMVEEARKLHLKIFTGCMSESTCGCLAAAHVAGKSDWIDLDGPLLISNDPFTGMNYKNGKIELGSLPGTGAIPAVSFAETWQ
jgi:L-alanine-DL-glutamate epimerase-like enolase superfamily enzyme